MCSAASSFSSAAAAAAADAAFASGLGALPVVAGCTNPSSTHVTRAGRMNEFNKSYHLCASSDHRIRFVFLLLRCGGLCDRALWSLVLGHERRPAVDRHWWEHVTGYAVLNQVKPPDQCGMLQPNVRSLRCLSTCKASREGEMSELITVGEFVPTRYTGSIRTRDQTVSKDTLLTGF